MAQSRSDPKPKTTRRVKDLLREIKTTPDLVELDLSNCSYRRAQLQKILDEAVKNKKITIWNFNNYNFRTQAKDITYKLKEYFANASYDPDCFDVLINTLKMAPHVKVLKIKNITTCQCTHEMLGQINHLHQVDWFDGIVDRYGYRNATNPYTQLTAKKFRFCKNDNPSPYPIFLANIEFFSRRDTLMTNYLSGTSTTRMLAEWLLAGGNRVKQFDMQNLWITNQQCDTCFHVEMEQFADAFRFHPSLQEVDFSNLEIFPTDGRSKVADALVYYTWMIAALAENQNITRVTISSTNEECQAHIEHEVKNQQPIMRRFIRTKLNFLFNGSSSSVTDIITNYVFQNKFTTHAVEDKKPKEFKR